MEHNPLSRLCSLELGCQTQSTVADPDLELGGGGEGGGSGLDLLALVTIFISSFFTPGPSPRSATGLTESNGLGSICSIEFNIGSEIELTPS